MRYNEAEAIFEEKLRAQVRAELAGAGVSQRQLADALGTSQSAVSHMLSDRATGLTVVEVFNIETACDLRPGTISRRAGLALEPTIEQLVYELPGVDAQAAEVILGGVSAARASALRKGHMPNE